jgi:hypothetical protein
MSIIITPVVRINFLMCVCVVCSLARPAEAQVEITGNLALGGGALLTDDPEVDGDGGRYNSHHGAFRFGLNGAVVFLRKSNRDFGLGFYTEVMTSSFRDVMPGGGIMAVIPVHRFLPLVLSGGAYYDYDGHHAGGVSGRLWWGVRNHNLTGHYNMTYGLWVEAKANLWGNEDLIVAAGVDIDLYLLVAPWQVLAHWLDGPDDL